MKTITLIIICVFSSFLMVGQTTFDLDWEQGVMGAAASFTIEQGDTVRWTWANGAPHSVTSQGGSAETFDSGVITGTGTMYEYTFTVVGDNPYICEVHPGSMFGTITVETVLSIQEKFEKNITFYPNPVEDKLIIESLVRFDAYEVYNLLGTKVGQGTGEGTYTHLDTTYLKSGIYFMRITADDLVANIKFIKK